MAKRQFMSKRPPGRNPSSKRAPSRRQGADEADHRPDRLIDASLVSSPLMEAIEDERVRLMEVKCVLHCMYVAMLYDDGDGDLLDYADAAKVSGRMISKALDQLDGARLQPLADQIQKAAPNAALVESG